MRLLWIVPVCIGALFLGALTGGAIAEWRWRNATIQTGEKLASLEQRILKIEQDLTLTEMVRKRLTDGHTDGLVRYLVQNINSILPVSPQNNLRWYVTRIKLLQPDLAWVQYSDGHTLGDALVRIAGSPSSIVSEVLALKRDQYATKLDGIPETVWDYRAR